ncbi:MAG: FMN-binding protein [Clostridiales bacterium]|nr:FMN-binding protein [Clostridiales bacterium]
MRKALSLMMTALLLLLTGCTARAEQHTGEAEGYGGPLKVRVTMNGEDVTKVEVIEHSETPGVGSRAIEALPSAIEEADSIDVDSVSGATITSNAIKQAVSQAMGLTGVVQEVIPMDGMSATEAQPVNRLMGVGMASTGRVGPGKDADGNQVYSFNVVFAAGEFEENGAIRTMQVDQLEIVTPNLGGGSAFSGFPGSVGEEDAFMEEVSAWQTKGMMGDNYRLTSGTWREQMDEYQRLMEGKTVDEVKEWASQRNNATVQKGEAAATAQPETNTSATMSLQSEYGDILLAIERAWEDARKDMPGRENTMVDTNTVTDTTDGEENLG